MSAPIRLLTVSSLYPNPAQPRHGIFVETRLRHLLATGEVTATVVAPVPWFPAGLATLSTRLRQSRPAHLPRREERRGITVYHPRYLAIPGLGMYLNPFSMAVALWWQLRRLARAGVAFDVVDGHYYYPDGVAIALLSRWFRRPFTVTARGTDINLIPRYALPRRLIQWAASRAAASITVCSALRDEMAALEIPVDNVHVLRNGVDLALFRRGDRIAQRQALDLTGPTLLSVGHLIERKGHHLVIEALRDLPDMTLLIAGDGDEESQLRKLAEQCGVTHRVHFLGALTQQELAEVYGAVDALVLASSREGWANVLLEAMACGTPVVATRIWGTPEVVQEQAAGVLVDERSPEALAAGVERLLANPPDRAATRAYAERFSWDDTIVGVLALMRDVSGVQHPR